MIDGDGNAAPSTEGGTAAVDTAICGESTDATLDIPVPGLPPLLITTTERMYIGVDFIDGLKVAFKAVFVDYCIAPVAPLPKLEFSNVQALVSGRDVWESELPKQPIQMLSRRSWINW